MFWGSLNSKNKNTKEFETHPGVIEMPRGDMFLAACSHILGDVYGFKRSTDLGMAVDANGDYIPLYTYPAIEYLLQFDYSDKHIFEYGSGASTLFWMRRAKQVVSIENDQQWFAKIKEQVSDNVELLYAEGQQFPKVIASLGRKYDVIVVDGAGFRYDCAELALQYLAPGGMIILDNADWHPNTASMLKASGLLQIDMAGFKPTESHTSTTSLFLDRQFDFPTLEKRQPAFAWGAKELHSADWDKPQIKS